MEQELQFLLYDLPDDSAKVQVVVRDETVWMTQKVVVGPKWPIWTKKMAIHLKKEEKSMKI